ncbi:arabinose efflux permease family protein [Terriglobus roseus DSM 18391]|uniref:Arabinose efflux permease family protein n=1 Tax=Terriglobus roseus (strain DSM 18391 / NRRL B-41598 / KBS 63) TaxID=926566 RepID=I3ZFD5_TERRK|nr:MFS transporter [Terriglobus roseus]AFL87953.1 arabinose efflux permease family protein [Terriglobus roseus DSM 18391]
MATGIVQQWKTLTSPQKNAFIACFLGWSLDAFDFFVLTYCITAIATDFHTGVEQVTEALFWTLVMRPVGALIFGALAEKIGRRPTLMINIISFCVFEVASGFAPTLGWLLVFRALFGIAMGGEWGVGAALAFETLPEKGRGFFSGLLQEGYVIGNLLAATVYGLVFPHLHPAGSGLLTNWRIMFFLGAAPAVLVFYIRSKVAESPAFLAGQAKAVKPSLNFGEVARYLPNFLFLVLLMTAFTSFSHGTQDLYPTFLQKGKGFAPARVGWVSDVGHIGALLGGITFGTLSERWGRRRCIVIAALLAIPMIYIWAFTFEPFVVATGGFLMQFMVQGAWGIIPAHLNELSPAAVRATFPGLAYQLGNLLSSRNAKFQTALARKYFHGQLGPILAMTVAIVAIAVSLLAGFGREAKGQSMLTTDDVAI